MQHFIILSSSYSMGKRIAMHYVIDKEMTPEMLSDEVKQIKNVCGESVSFSTHFIETEYSDWHSVVDKDAFFEGVHVVDSLVGFIDLINKDRVLSAIDVANYIICSMPCTHLQLEKLIYICYAEYLCETKQQLFVDKIYAFKYGPIVKSIYDEYKGQRWIAGSGKKSSEKRMSARSRILFALDGIKKMSVIDSTIEMYGKLRASELVSLTHVKGGPWDMTDKSRQYSEITDNDILLYHSREVCV